MGYVSGSEGKGQIITLNVGQNEIDGWSVVKGLLNINGFHEME